MNPGYSEGTGIFRASAMRKREIAGPGAGNVNVKRRPSSTECELPMKRNNVSVEEVTMEWKYTKEDFQRSDHEAVMESDNSSPMCFFDLAWVDILFPLVLPYLSWKDLFRLRRVSHRAFKLVQEYFSQIRCIDLSSELHFTRSAFQIVTENCTNLHKLVVRESSWIQDGDLIRLFKANHNLVHIDISGCLQLKGPCLLALAVNCKMVIALLLRDCPWITQGAVETLIAHLRKLQTVDLTSCAALTNYQIFPLVQAYPRLVELHLAQIPSINDVTLAIVARQCRQLTYLDIRCCMCVTDNGIRSVAQYCTQLKTLKVEGCQLVTEYSLTLIRSRGTVTIDRPYSDFFKYMPRILIPRVQV